MLICPQCQNDDLLPARKSPVDPSKDLFRCTLCNNTFARYEGGHASEDRDNNQE